MNYFISKDELCSEIEKAVDGIFTAVGRSLYELEHKFSLLINVGIAEKKSPAKIRKRGKTMEEKDFEQILEKLMEHVLKGQDEELILMADDLQKSFQEFKEKKEKLKEKLNKIYRNGQDFIKEQGIEKKGEKTGQ